MPNRLVNADGRRAASLVVLTLQNTALALLLHTSRIRGSSYSAATAVLLNEIFKGTISFAVAYKNCKVENQAVTSIPLAQSLSASASRSRRPGDDGDSESTAARLSTLKAEIFSKDCWKLSIPATLYVIQNNLQFVAASNLDVATFQVSYQLKILTTAVFSVLMLKKRLTGLKWSALVFLALGVGIVQVQAAGVTPKQTAHEMHPMRGFVAVFSACVTSGLAGVYFEMVLKGSNADLWVRNVQLSLFSLVPALLPALRPVLLAGGGVTGMLKGFGPWAWSVVWCQVIGGLVTALVIKYSDNIVKGFATSLSIIMSFASSALLFPDEFRITTAFLFGTATVLAATYLYNRPSAPAALEVANANGLSLQAPQSMKEPLLPTSSRPNSPSRNNVAQLGIGGMSPNNRYQQKDTTPEAIQVSVNPRPESPLMTAADLLPDGRRRQTHVAEKSDPTR